MIFAREAIKITFELYLTAKNEPDFLSQGYRLMEISEKKILRLQTNALKSNCKSSELEFVKLKCKS